jgi:molecular chaperone HtpG
VTALENSQAARPVSESGNCAVLVRFLEDESMNPAAPIFVSGILHRFGKDLHDDPCNAFRLLVDRAHEACLKQRAARPAFVPAILVTSQSIGGVAQVSICDNGAPIDPNEVRTLYATSRSGRAGAVRRALSETGIEGADAVVGKFGVAMLAAFLVADQIVVATRSHDAAPEQGVRYICTSRTYHVEPYRMARPGTYVQLRIRHERSAIGEIDAVRNALRDHARFLELPIRVGSDPRPINAA